MTAGPSNEPMSLVIMNSVAGPAKATVSKVKSKKSVATAKPVKKCKIPVLKKFQTAVGKIQ